MGVGVGMTRDCSTLMVAQYFKRRREFVEIFIVSGSGLGIAIMSAFIKTAIDAIGWRYVPPHTHTRSGENIIFNYF